MQRFALPSLFNWVLLTLLFTACKPAPKKSDYTRAHAPWVVRSVLDDQARMLTLALHDQLWAAYSAEDGNLYKVWRGGVNFDGAVYTTAHGPQPSTLGDAYFVNTVESPWKLSLNGQTTPLEVDYGGHRVEKEQVYVMYTLQAKDIQIKVEERPEHLENETGQHGLERQFTVSGMPDGASLSLDINLSSVSSQRNIQTDGEFTVNAQEDRTYKNINALDLEATLNLNANGTTTFTTFFTRPLIENENKVVGAEDEEERPLGYRLIARNDCKTCHNTYLKTIGPAYIDVARKYRNNNENITLLASKVKKGGSGVWGPAVMNAHDDLPDEDIRAMVEYVMTLDAEEEAEMAAEMANAPKADLQFIGGATVEEADLFPGTVVRIFTSKQDLQKIADLNTNQKPVFEGVISEIYAENSDLKEIGDNFGMIFEGYLKITKSNNYTFRLQSDDGSRLSIDDRIIIDHDGPHGASVKDGEIALEAGFHPFKVEYFQGRGGKMVALRWRSFDTDQWEVLNATNLMHLKQDRPNPSATPPPIANTLKIPGDGFPVAGVHPSYALSQARPDGFAPKVGGIDFLADGRLVVSTWDAEGAVYIVENHASGDPASMTAKKIATGLAEPLGLKVVDNEIYVLQKQELTKLVDVDGDDLIDEYQTICNDWMVSSNFHEFAFGLVYQDGWFYGTLAIAIMPGGASRKFQTKDRGKVFRVNKETGEFQIIAEGLRTPNGIGIGKDGEIFVADNQGDWLPSSKILHITEGAFFASRAVDSARAATLPVKLPVVWLPQDEIGNSPSTPIYLNDGPYEGQMIHGEVTNGGVKRVFVESVNGEYQGAVFRFIQGLEAGVNRMTWAPDGSLYIGGIGSSGNWQHNGTLWYGLQRLKYTDNNAFEMLAVHAKSNGVEIELTHPLADGFGWDPAVYDIQQWRYEPTNAYGGPKLDKENLRVRSASVSEDKKKIFLEIPGIKPNRVVYVHLPSDWTSADDREIWSTEAWYTMNQVPSGNPGMVLNAPDLPGLNELSASEEADGWKLLFNGKDFSGWRNFNKTDIGAKWVIDQDAMHLDANKEGEGLRGGDLVFDEDFDNFELRLDWRIGPCGNSGIIFNVQEGDEFDAPWRSGPEMQVLDNSCHPDARIRKHRAGDLYDLIECTYETVKPAGNWNSIRLRIQNGQLEQWQNGRKVVSTELWTPEWEAMVKGSKFKDMPHFGKYKKGKISLQDHSDPVWFRNIKIKKLDSVQ